jgi:SAM-dependent methyltransferase
MDLTPIPEFQTSSLPKASDVLLPANTTANVSVVSTESDVCPESTGTPCIFKPIGVDLGEVTVVRCARCGLGRTLPEIDDIASLYADRESWDFQPRSSPIALAIKRLAFRAFARSILRTAGPSPGVIVDYGCGSGLLTSSVQKVSRAQVYALDFHENAPAELEEPVYLPFHREVSLAGSADLLIASHVLEHSNDPARLLARMAQIVKPGGHLVLEVPNIDCWGSRVFGVHWAGWYLPYHRLHFSRKSLRGVVEKAGLQIIDEQDASVPSLGRTLANIRGSEYHLGFLLVGAALQPLQWFLEKVTRRPAALRFVCRKPHSTCGA